MTTSEPVSVTTVPVNYCQLTDSSNYYLTISFVLCIDYNYIIHEERTTIIRKVSHFLGVPINRIAIYRVLVENQQKLYERIKSPRGLTCSNRKRLDDGLADTGGWRSAYEGQKASVSVHFKCKDAQSVLNLVKKIKYKISVNSLHDHVGTRVIGWVLYRWHCLLAPTTTSPPP